MPSTTERRAFEDGLYVSVTSSRHDAGSAHDYHAVNAVPLQQGIPESINLLWHVPIRVVVNEHDHPIKPARFLEVQAQVSMNFCLDVFVISRGTRDLRLNDQPKGLNAQVQARLSEPPVRQVALVHEIGSEDRVQDEPKQGLN